jgi:hypothetical protein
VPEENNRKEVPMTRRQRDLLTGQSTRHHQEMLALQKAADSLRRYHQEEQQTCLESIREQLHLNGQAMHVDLEKLVFVIEEEGGK